MRINKHKQLLSKHKIIIAIVITVLFLGVGAATWALTGGVDDFGESYEDAFKPENTVNLEDATDEQKTAGNKAKEDFINRQDDKNPEETPVPSANVSVTITSVSQRDGDLQVRTIIDTTTSGGSCKFTMSREGNTPVVIDAGIQIMGSYAVCQGFDVRLAGFEKGEWNMRLEYVNGMSSGMTERKITVT